LSEENKNEKIDKVLKILSKPVSKHILETLAGVNPGNFKGKINPQNGDTQNE